MKLAALAISLALLTTAVGGQDIEPQRVIVFSGYFPSYEAAEPRPTPHIYLAKVPRKVARKFVRKLPAGR